MGFGIGSAAGSVGSSTIPLVIQSMVSQKLNIYTLFTGCGLLGIIFIVFLPETLNKPLTNEIEEIQY